MNPTPVPTAQQSPTTLKTGNTGIAPTANSGMPQRIDEFIKRKLAEANSEDGSGISDSAIRAARFGFVNCANARYSKFLAAFQSSSQLTETYQNKYPNCLFLSWAALHAVIKALDLWLDLPEHYMGAVPPEQLPWLEIFELEAVDLISVYDIEKMLDVSGQQGDKFRAALNVSHRGVDARWTEARSRFFVVAPKEAFNSKSDWLDRFRSLQTASPGEPRSAPDDPLVIRFCRGGCLVVAAWGDEAAALNGMAKEVRI